MESIGFMNFRGRHKPARPSGILSEDRPMPGTVWPGEKFTQAHRLARAI
jgi:hypothetical protein